MPAPMQLKPGSLEPRSAPALAAAALPMEAANIAIAPSGWPGKTRGQCAHRLESGHKLRRGAAVPPDSRAAGAEDSKLP